MSKKEKIVGTAPYNFVPLPERIIYRYQSPDDLPTHDARRVEDLNLLSGEIMFDIVAQTPILVADGKDEERKEEPKKFVKDVYGKYEIPGSTLRGLIRNTVSVLSLSDWTEQIDDERFFYRAVAESSTTNGKHYKNVLNIKTEKVNQKQESIPLNVQAGFITKLNKDEYGIYPAKSDAGRKGRTYYKVNAGNLTNKKEKERFFNQVKKGFTVEDATFSLNKHGKVVKLFHKNAHFKGHLLYSGFFKSDNKKKVSAYLINEIDPDQDPIRLRLKDVKAYKADLRFRLSKFPKEKRACVKKFFELPEKIGIEHAKPCFYLEYDGMVYFGFTAFLRLLYPYSTKDLLPDYIKEKKTGVDYTSALFGFSKNDDGQADDKNVKSYASRVHFHSAKICNDVEPLEPVAITPGTPRASAYRFYLDQDFNREFNDYYTYLTKETIIRGMKQYWIKDPDPPALDEKSKRYGVKLEVLPCQTRFKAKITFDQLHEDELGLLLWGLTGPKYHQIGMGKAYGYGVVMFERVECFVTDNRKMYNDLTKIFDTGETQVSINEYIQNYKNRMKQLLEESGYSIDETFELENLRSIWVFLAMKEKSKLKKEEMRYTPLDKYPDAVLPTAEQLLNNEKIVIRHSANEQETKKQKNKKNQQVKRNSFDRPNKPLNHRRKSNGRAFTHQPFSDLLKDYYSKKK